MRLDTFHRTPGGLTRTLRAALFIVCQAFAVAFAAQAGAQTAPAIVASASGRIALPESVRTVSMERSDLDAAVAGAPRPAMSHALTEAEAAAPLKVEVVLRTRNYEELKRRVAAGETISPAEMAARYLPRVQDFDAVRKWLAAQGLSVAPPGAGHAMVIASGSPAQLSAAFQVKFARVVFRAEEYTAAISVPTLPAEMAALVSNIHGLQPFLHPRKFSAKKAAVDIDVNPPYMVNDILEAYNASGTALTGAGQQIGIVIDTVPRDTDLSAFWAENGVNQSLSNIITVNVSGGTLPKPSGEETLDVSWSSGIASGAQIVIYACGDLSNVQESYSQILDDLQEGTRPGLHQISMSYAGGEITDETDSDMQSTSQLFTSMAAYGVTLFAAAGDNGAYGVDGKTVQVNYPASDPSVVGVGGTTMTLYTTGVVGTEVGWSFYSGSEGASGGGISTFFSRPSWQTGSTVSSGTMRLVPDVSLAADPNDGGYLVLNSEDDEYGGTSWSSPTWAGFCALLNQARANAGLSPLGIANNMFYPLLGTTSFRDITSGSNGVYTAGAGYDMVTGLGVPDFEALASALSAASEPKITSALTASGDVGSSFTYQITASNSPVSFAATGLPAGLSVSAAGLISGAPTVGGSFSVALSATNATGTGTATLALTIASAAPVITSGLAANAQEGVAFSYQITASGSPASFAATGLPAGLSISAAGLIGGTPAAIGSFSVTLSATNATGTGTAALELTVQPGVPAITSPLAVTAKMGIPFSYQVTASGSPTSFAARGLPEGLGINAATGLISGTPTAAGAAEVTLKAANAGGIGTAKLVLDVVKIPVVTVTASIPKVSDLGGKDGQFMLKRTDADIGQALTVYYVVRGSAQAGVDYVMLKGSKRIPAGQATAHIEVTPLPGDLGGLSEATVKVVLQSTGEKTYRIGAESAAKVKIVAGN